MRRIKTHKSRNCREILEILVKTGNYTMCTLPHYRYEHSQNSCKTLERLGYIEKCGALKTGINFKATELVKKWDDAGRPTWYNFAKKFLL